MVSAWREAGGHGEASEAELQVWPLVEAMWHIRIWWLNH